MEVEMVFQLVGDFSDPISSGWIGRWVKIAATVGVKIHKVVILCLVGGESHPSFLLTYSYWMRWGQDANKLHQTSCVGPPPFSTVIRLSCVKRGWSDSQAMLTHRDAHTFTTTPQHWINTIKKPHPPVLFLSYLTFFSYAPLWTHIPWNWHQGGPQILTIVVKLSAFPQIGY